MLDDKHLIDIVNELVKTSLEIRRKNKEMLRDLSTGSWIYDHKEFLESIQMQPMETEKDRDDYKELFI